jgi:riboflavin kinase/FMN adenylyltransferase
MKDWHSLAAVPEGAGPSVVTIGNFDGVHVGHRDIIRRVLERARRDNLTPSAVTFDPHPARILAPDRAPKLLMTVHERLQALEEAGIETVLLIPFSLEFARLTPEEFVKLVLVDRLQTRCVMVGADFRFGHKQSGNVETLRDLGRRWGFDLEIVPAFEVNGERVSSTQIRNLVAAGRPSRACRLLGAPFRLEGPIIKGHGIGRRSTVPTLNLAPENEMLPRAGVYATRTHSSGRLWASITNVGYRPTFSGSEISVETFILDEAPFETPDGIELEFLSWVREERKFESPEALKSQILRDAGAVRRFHRRVASLRVG